MSAPTSRSSDRKTSRRCRSRSICRPTRMSARTLRRSTRGWPTARCPATHPGPRRTSSGFGAGSTPAWRPEDAVATPALCTTPSGWPLFGRPRRRFALRRGPQLVERCLPAPPDVPRGKRRGQLADALERHVVLHPHRRPPGRRRQDVAHVPGEGLALLVLLEHVGRLRARHPRAHLLISAGVVQVVIARVGPRIALRPRPRLEVTLEPPLRRTDRAPDV